MATAWTDSTLTAGMPIKKVHIDELRTAIQNERTRRGYTTAAFTDPTITSGSTGHKKEHTSELRNNLTSFTSLSGTLPTAGTIERVIDITAIRAKINALEATPKYNGVNDCNTACAGLCTGSCTGTTICHSNCHNDCDCDCHDNCHSQTHYTYLHE